MNTISYKNTATGLAEIFEVGSRGDRKRRDDPKHYTCLNPEALSKPPAPDAKPAPVDPKKPEKSG